MTFWILQSFNGISYLALLFLLAAGLSLIKANPLVRETYLGTE